MGSAADALIRAENLRKVYRRGAESVVAVDDISLTVAAGEFAAIVGPSGAGKTTLLQLLGAMDTPTGGRLFLAGQEVSRLSDGQLTRLRREQIGFVFQHFGLLPTLTVAENVALPALFRRTARDRVDLLLDRVGLSHRRGHRPSELSGGEMQRAAIARALINAPRLLLADEPTGNLDSATGAAILELLRDLQRDDGLTLVVVTHNPTLADAAGRRITLRDGKIAPE
jgi:putative ABC transport system ATP-binding protein